MSAYPTLNGMQYRGPGGDGRAMHALSQRCGWASYLTRDGVRVDPRDITDLTQLAKDLGNEQTADAPDETAIPCSGRYLSFRPYQPALAAPIIPGQNRALADAMRALSQRQLADAQACISAATDAEWPAVAARFVRPRLPSSNGDAELAPRGE